MVTGAVRSKVAVLKVVGGSVSSGRTALAMARSVDCLPLLAHGPGADNEERSKSRLLSSSSSSLIACVP